MATQSVDQIRKYEGVVIMHPDSSEEDQKNLFRKNAEIIKSSKGEVNHLDTWGRRRLGNPIEKLTRGVYFHTTFTARGDAIAELERTMRINDKVLRFAHVRLDDRVSLPKFVEEFKNALAETMRRESEREAKAQARRQSMMQAREGGFGDRDRERGDREGGRGPRRRDEGHGRDFEVDDSDGE